MTLVDAPEAVTAGWLTAVLQAAGHSGEVSSFDARRVGTGQVGQNIRFTLRYASGDGPASVVGKFASPDPTSRATGIAQNNYGKEVHFYRALSAKVNIQVPRVYFVDLDPETGLFCLIMEDLAPAVQGDQLQGCTPQAATLAIEQAALLHGPTWNEPWLLEDPAIAPAEAGSLESIWQLVYPGFVDRYQARMPAEHLALLERFTAKLAAYVTPPNDHFAIVHGDFRLDNMLFDGPYPLTVVDWQTPTVGHPLLDVAYFLGAGLLPEARRAHEHALVRRYHELIDIPGYDFDTCVADYARFSFSGLVMAVIASMIVGQTERGDDMFMAMANRHAEQALDLNAEALLG